MKAGELRVERQVRTGTELKEHGLLFKPHLVDKLRADLKHQTRRVVEFHNSLVDGHGGLRRIWDGLDWSDAWRKVYVDPGPSPAGNPGPYLHVPFPAEGSVHRIYPKWSVGDRIWVRETWRVSRVRAGGVRIEFQAGGMLWTEVLADDPNSWLERYRPDGRWRPSIFLPKWAARLWYQITNLRAQRIVEITCADIRAEGIDCPEHDFQRGLCTGECPALREHFAETWDAINGKRYSKDGKVNFGWDPNPWVWAITLRKLDRREA